jgi:hypothetical protein
MSLSRNVIQRGSSCALAIACSLACLACGDCVQAPSIASTSPANATVGTEGLTLIVNGSDFRRDSTINWNDTAVATTFVNSHQLKATIPASDLVSPVTAKVTVVTPPPSRPVMIVSTSTSSATGSVSGNCVGGMSNPLNFTIDP